MKQTSEVTFHGGPADGRIFVYQNPLPTMLLLPQQPEIDFDELALEDTIPVSYVEYKRRGTSFDYDWVEKK